MMDESLVLLAAHGAGDCSRANRFVEKVAASLERSLGRPVAASFHLGAPSCESVIESAREPSVLVVPLLMADGYFARNVLRERALAAAQRGGKRVRFLRPIGMWDGVQREAIESARRAVYESSESPRRTEVLVVGHGTDRSSTSGATAGSVARKIEATLPVRSARAVFLDQEPHLDAEIERASAGQVVIVPFLLGGGRHACMDIESAVRRRTGDFAGVLTASVGESEGFERRLLEEIGCELEQPALRLGSRGSALARKQLVIALDALERASARIETRFIQNTGDRDRITSISQFETASPFADEMLGGLDTGALDLAAHSRKDLAIGDDQVHPIVAYLPRHDAREALVSRDGISLQELPAGARVGTSSDRRATQVRAIRPDLTIAPIRGDVESRVGQVMDGPFDATVLAVAGLERLGLHEVISQRFDIDEIMPEAGQGIIAIQRRAGCSCPWASGVDDSRSRACAEAERTVAREVSRRSPGAVIAAHATVSPDGEIDLRARLVGRRRVEHVDARGRSRSWRRLGVEIAELLLSRRSSLGGSAA